MSQAEDGARSLPRGVVRRRALRRLDLPITSDDFTDDERRNRWGLPGLPDVVETDGDPQTP